MAAPLPPRSDYATSFAMDVMMVSRSIFGKWAGPLGLAAALVAPNAALAQKAVTSQAVVQQTPGPDSQALNSALARLGRNPKDVNALIDAGNAALALGDVDAAVGFFANADQLQPNSPRVRAGLAAALVQNGNPFDAIPLFTEAETAGGMDQRLNADRGLAYDLVGDNATAQKYYRQALGAGAGDEVTRRLALSQAIGGDREGMEATLLPLLQKGDKPAFRTRAFALAIAGKTDEAVSIAYQSMPQDLAAGIAPYLRYMPRLTKAQQASAATFGHFPRAAEIGRDDPRVLRYAPPVHVATAEGKLVPKGEPLGKLVKSTSEKGKSGNTKSGEAKLAKADGKKGDEAKLAAAKAPVTAIARAAPPELNPGREESVAPLLVKPPVNLPPLAAQPKTETPAVVVPAATPTPAVTTVAANTAGATASPAIKTSPPVTVAPPPVVVTPARPARFADVFGDLGAPVAVATPKSGAVDIRKIAAAKPKTEAKAESKPANPSRIWVQVGVGRGKAALQADWKSLVKEAPELLKGKSAAITDWGKTNRLLTGPFDSESAAKSLVAKLKKEKIDTFIWTSPTGQVVDPL
ncbi:MAG: SPOR domain-containing protein [Novosphingobium sp.]